MTKTRQKVRLSTINKLSEEMLNQVTIDTFQEDGIAFIPGLFKAHVESLRIGVQKNIEKPGPFAAENTKEGEKGRFFDDYCNWQRIDEFRNAAFDKNVAKTAALLMQSKTVQMFHDHVLVKEAGTLTSTPWHTDGPYYFIKGIKTLSFWVPLDPVKDATLRMVAGSHKWPKPVLPTKWLSNENFYPTTDEYLPVPDPEKEHMDIKEFKMEPGDDVAFNFNILHGAREATADQRRRAFSLRLLGDDTSYTERPGPTSPPFPQHNMEENQVLRTDWFPFIEF